MSVRRTVTTWLRRTFAWSRSRESWHERTIWILLLLSAALLAFLTWRNGLIVQLEERRIAIPFSFQAALWLWAAWGLIALVLLGRGTIKLFGPVLFYDMVRSARRSRYFLLRGFYCVILFLILFFIWMTSSLHQLRDEEVASRLAEQFFEWFTVTQLIAVLLLTPAYVAGAIAEEKDRKTLEFLLATDLRNREIVFSKFLSRLANLVLFLLTGLPFLSMLQLLGGIDPNLVMASFAFTLLTTIGLGAISILNSVVYKRPRDAITVTYLFLVAYYGLTIAFMQVQPPTIFGRAAAMPTVGEEVLDFIYSGNIIVLLAKIYDAGRRGGLATALPALLLEYAFFYGGLALLCIAWATLRLRRIALKQSFGKVGRSLKIRGRAAVTELPMLWKEIHVEGSLKLNWLALALVGLMVLASFANPFVALVEYSVNWGWYGGREQNFARDMNLWARLAGTGVACLTILGVAIRAANSLGVERERQTMDGLLTTPLGSTAILAAKFIGSLCSVRLGWVWLGLIYVIALLTGGLHIFAFPLVIAAWFIYACAAALIGLWYSMVSRSALRATVLSVLTCVALGVGHWLVWLCCVPLFLLSGSGGGDGPFYLAKFQAGMTPPAALFVMAFQGEELRGNMDGSLWVELMAFSLFGLFLTSLASLFFWNGVLVPKFRVLTGRDEERTSDNTPRGPELPAPARAPSGAALDAAAPAAGAPDAAISNLTVEAGDGHP